MGSNTGHVLTLANSIIGVSVLAMPFCFKQCGIALSILMLYFSSLITKLACHYLIKSAIMERMKNFEMLAFRAFGSTGKMMVELCIIGFMLGTCVAFFVIMGDLGPSIIGPIIGIEHPSALRPSVLIGVAVFVVLPLGLLRNVDSLSAICAASIAFYLCLVLKVVIEAAGNLVAGDWMDKVIWWRPSGILQCIPIFSMALSCQTQLFEIFDSLPNAPLERTNAVVRLAINMTTAFYVAVGFFGYAAYCNQSFTGNVMMNFSPTIASDVMKIGFLLSIAVSFPLVIFPCRASIYSFLYSKIQHGYEGLGSSHIPETKFQCITLVIVTLSLIIGLVIPNIEVVLGLIGSTIGVFICVIIPGMIFNNLSTKNNNEKLVAQCLVGIGLIIMVMGTYANLFATEEVMSGAEINMKGLDQNFNLEQHDSFKKEIEKAMKKLDLEESPKIQKKKKIKPLKKQEPVVVPEPPPKMEKQEAPKLVVGPAPEPIQPEPPKESSKKDPVPLEQELPKEIVVPKKSPKPDPVVPEPPKEVLENKVEKLPPPVIQKEEIKVKDDQVKEKIQDASNLLKKVEEIKMKSIDENELKKEEMLSSEMKNKPLKEDNTKLDKILPKIEENKKIDISPKENLTMSMAQGVPLPLVVKGVENLNQESLPQSRDILKSDREKRDTEIVEHLDSKQKSKDNNENCPKTDPPPVENSVKNEIVSPAPDNLIKSPIHISNDVQLVLDKKPEPPSNNVDLQAIPPIPDDLIKSPQHLSNDVQLVLNKKIEPPSNNLDMRAIPPIPDDLIKSPRHLSNDIQLVLDKKPEPPSNNLDIGAIPQKRDLKSLPSPEKEPKQET